MGVCVGIDFDVPLPSFAFRRSAEVAKVGMPTIVWGDAQGHLDVVEVRDGRWWTSTGTYSKVLEYKEKRMNQRKAEFDQWGSNPHLIRTKDCAQNSQNGHEPQFQTRRNHKCSYANTPQFLGWYQHATSRRKAMPWIDCGKMNGRDLIATSLRMIVW